MHAIVTLAKSGLSGGRNRSIHLVVTLALTVAAWLLLAAIASPFVNHAAIKGSGVTIRNGSQTNGPLPLRYSQRIEAVPGARDVSWFIFQIVVCGQPSRNVTLNVYGGPGAASALQDRGVDRANLDRWISDPLALLVSDKTAADCGWQIGQGIEPQVAFHNNRIPFHVIGTFHNKHDLAFAHFDYINRIAPIFGKDKVLWFLARSGAVRGDELLAARIQEKFANDFPTVNATTNAVVQNAWARFGKVQQLLALVMAAVVLCAVSVFTSALAHSAEQRRSKFALLQVLGFQRRVLFGALLLEVLAVVLIGGITGTGLALWASGVLAPTQLGSISNGFKVPTWALLWLPVWLLALLTSALLWPAAIIAHVRPTDYRAT